MSREHSGLSQTLTPAEFEKILTRDIGRGVDRYGRPICELPAFDMPPQVVHGMQCWRGDRQPPELDVPRSRYRQTLLGGLGRAAIFAQDDVPSSPMRPHHREEVLMRGVIPMVRDQQHQRARAHVEGAVEHALGPIPGERDTSLLPQATVATR